MDFKEKARIKVTEEIDPTIELTNVRKLQIDRWAIKIERALKEAYEEGVKQGREEQREELKKKFWPHPESNINGAIDGRRLWEILSAKGEYE